MKPLVQPTQAWFCTVVSGFAIVILGTLALLFNANHHEVVGGTDDPSDAPAAARTIFIAVLVYVAFFFFCLSQGLWHLKQSRRGAITLQ